MKKLILALFLLAMILPVYAQDNSKKYTSEYSYKNVYVEKIFPSLKGYIVVYSTSKKMATVGIPIEWFHEIGGKAEIVKLSKGKEWPSMTVYYKNGEFSHVRLYVHALRTHSTWGTVPMTADVSDYFEDTEEIKLDL
jgi:hypothetical protein